MSRDAALALAKKGFKVFRLDGKIPRAGFLKEATSDPARIAELWDDLSSDWNVGILCDELLVLDFDVKDGLPGTSEYLVAKATYSNDESFSARTPSGGFHLYFRLPTGVRLANSSKKIGKATDTRSWHGYVAGPGSQGYSWLLEPGHLIDLPLAPPELIALCEKAPEAKADDSGNADVKLDTKAAISAAVDYLEKHAPGATIGSRDSTAYRVAAKVRDFGISETRCVDLLLSHWNETKVDPPLEPDKIEEDVDHAYRYAQNPIGRDVPGAEFNPTYVPPDPKPRLDPEWPKATQFAIGDPADIPPREWIVDGMLARGYVTALVAPSGAGKTQWTMQLALGIAAGRDDIALGRVVETGARVWCWNQEDDMPELRRRLAAAARQFAVDDSAIGDRVLVDSGVDLALYLSVRDPETGFLRRTRFVEKIIKHLIEEKIAVWSIDPLTEFHEADENNNPEMRAVMATLRYIAVKANCAVLVGHHTKKPDGASSEGFAGNANSARGASSLQGVTRVMLTLYAMSEKDAGRYNVPKDDRGAYVRLDGAKSNISEAGRGLRPRWLKWRSVDVGNGDKVGVLTPVELAQIRTRVERLQDTADQVAEALSGREPGVYAWKTLAEEMGFTPDQAKRWMAETPAGDVETISGKYTVIKKAGRGGSLIKWNGACDNSALQ